jgi:hypothetical protein
MRLFLPFTPRLAAFFFFAAATMFFMLNPAAFEKLDVLNVLQFNMQGVKYAFVMAWFAYALPGALLTGYFSWHLLRSPARFRVEIVLLLLAGSFLLQLGAISTAPNSTGRTQYLELLTWLFAALHGVAWLWIAFTGHSGSKYQRFTDAALGIYILYRVPGNILFGTDDIQVNLPIILCFAWYASRPFFKYHLPR